MGRKSNLYMSEPKAWLNMLRISNAPTIVSNTMVGAALAIVAHQAEWEMHITAPPLQLAKPLIGIIIVLLLLYFAGMVLNDAFDAERDATLRPDRPIPLGIITVRQAWITGLIMLVIGMLLAFRIGVGAGISTVALTFYILLYTFLHHIPIAAIPLMAICRGLVYIVTAATLSESFDNTLLIYAGILGIYTALLTLIGTFEHRKQSTFSWVVWIALIPALLPVILFAVDSPVAWLAYFAFAVWMYFAWNNLASANHQPVKGMHKMLSGFALLDCILIASLGEYFIMIVSAFCFILTVAAHRKIIGT